MHSSVGSESLPVLPSINITHSTSCFFLLKELRPILESRNIWAEIVGLETKLYDSNEVNSDEIPPISQEENDKKCQDLRRQLMEEKNRQDEQTLKKLLAKIPEQLESTNLMKNMNKHTEIHQILDKNEKIKKFSEKEAEDEISKLTKTLKKHAKDVQKHMKEQIKRRVYYRNLIRKHFASTTLKVNEGNFVERDVQKQILLRYK